MKTKKYILISEFGDIQHFTGEYPEGVQQALEQRIYNLIDITDPVNPQLYSADNQWTKCRLLSKFYMIC